MIGLMHSQRPVIFLLVERQRLMTAVHVGGNCSPQCSWKAIERRIEIGVSLPLKGIPLMS